jgi:hypothetical protein
MGYVGRISGEFGFGWFEGAGLSRIYNNKPSKCLEYQKISRKCGKKYHKN